jgi:hypothetical protein
MGSVEVQEKQGLLLLQLEALYEGRKETQRQ